MSKERSPRELCSTTMGTSGISYSFSTRPWLASLLRPVGCFERAVAHLEANGGTLCLERLAQQSEVREQAVTAVVGAPKVERLERFAPPLRGHPRGPQEGGPPHPGGSGVPGAPGAPLQPPRHEP